MEAGTGTGRESGEEDRSCVLPTSQLRDRNGEKGRYNYIGIFFVPFAFFFLFPLAGVSIPSFILTLDSFPWLFFGRGVFMSYLFFFFV